MSKPQAIKVQRKMRRLLRKYEMTDLVSIDVHWARGFHLKVEGVPHLIFSIEEFIRGRLVKKEPIKSEELEAQMNRFLKQIYFARAAHQHLMPAFWTNAQVTSITNIEGCP